MTALRNTYPISPYRYETNYASVYIISNTSGYYTLFDKGCVFFGGYVGESGTTSSAGSFSNILANTTSYGDMNYNKTTTDGVFVSWGYDEKVTMIGSKYSRYYLNTTLPAGVIVNMSIGIYTAGGGSTTTISIMTNQTDGGGNTTLCSYSLTGAAIGRYNHNCSYALMEDSDDIIVNLTSTVATSYGAIWEINVGTGILESNTSAPPAFVGNTLDEIDDLTQTEGALYNFSYLDEETQALYNLSTSGTLNKSDQRVYCTPGVSERNVSDQFNLSYILGVKEIPSKIETFLTYDDGSDYFRRMSFCDRYLSYGGYLINTSTHTATLFTFTIDDQSSNQMWRDGIMCLSRYVGTTLDDVDCDRWAADNTIIAYLITNREYSLNLYSEDCSEEKNVGWITASAADTSKTITVSGMDFNVSNTGILEGAGWNIYWDNSSGRVNATFVDTDDEVESFWWGVYWAHNNSLAYEDNTTSNDYKGTYLGSSVYQYYSRIVIESEEGDTLTFGEGNLNKIEKFFEEFEYEGEGFLGLESETFFLLASLGAIGATTLMAGPVSVGVASVLVVIETFTFSVFGWLPFLDNVSGQWPLILATVGIIAVFLHYTKGVRQ